MEENYLIPDLSESNYIQANNDNAFLNSLLDYSLETSTAISRKKIPQIQGCNIKLVRTGEVV